MKSAKPARRNGRNIALYEDDYQWFCKAAEAADRSKIRMVRFVISKWRKGEAVLLKLDNGKASSKHEK